MGVTPKQRVELLAFHLVEGLGRGDVLVSHCYDAAGHDCEGWHERFIMVIDADAPGVVAETVDEWGTVRLEQLDAGNTVHILQPRPRKASLPSVPQPRT